MATVHEISTMSNQQPNAGPDPQPATLREGGFTPRPGSPGPPSSGVRQPSSVRQPSPDGQTSPSLRQHQLSDSDSDDDHQITYHQMSPRGARAIEPLPRSLESYPLDSGYPQISTQSTHHDSQQYSQQDSYQPASHRTAAFADENSAPTSRTAAPSDEDAVPHAVPPYRTPPYNLPPPEAAYDSSYLQPASMQDSYQPASPRLPVRTNSSSPPYRLPLPQSAYGQGTFPHVQYTVTSPSPSVRNPSPLGLSDSRQTNLSGSRQTGGAMARVPAYSANTVTEWPVRAGGKVGRRVSEAGEAREPRDGSSGSSGSGPVLDTAIMMTVLFLVSLYVMQACACTHFTHIRIPSWRQLYPIQLHCDYGKPRLSLQ